MAHPANLNSTASGLTDDEYEILELTGEEDELLIPLDFQDGHLYHTTDEHATTTDEYYGLVVDGVDSDEEDNMYGLHIDQPGGFVYIIDEAA